MSPRTYATPAADCKFFPEKLRLAEDESESWQQLMLVLVDLMGVRRASGLSGTNSQSSVPAAG